MSSDPAAATDESARGSAFLALYDSALPYVYGYLLARATLERLAHILDRTLHATEALLVCALNPTIEGEHRMTLQTPDATEQLRQGDISYLSLWVRDVARAAAFYPAVLGWHLSSAEDDGGRQVEGLSVSHGLA